MLTAQVIRDAVERALLEDSPWGDLTSETLFGKGEQAVAVMVSREAGVMSGASVVDAVFRVLHSEAQVTVLVDDGEAFEAGQRLVEITTDVHSLLRGERIGLNFVQRMAGIATRTRAFVDAVASTKARIVDTRKTTPGLRAFEKYAVQCGGALNHRFSLSDAVLVKDNHLAHMASKGVSVEDALQRVRRVVPFTTHIEVEVDRIDQIDAILASGVVDSVLIDNFSLDEMRAAAELISGRCLVNASGGIRLPEHAQRIAETGVDLISVGALTHSAPVIDIGLDMKIE